MPNTALVFDWDESFVGGNTDTVVPQTLAPELVEHIRARHGTTPWTALMADVARRMHARGLRPDDIRGALRGMHVDPNMVSALRAAKTGGASVFVISDANTVYIDTIAEHVGVADDIDEVVTNSAAFDARGCLVITPRHTGPAHGCA